MSTVLGVTLNPAPARVEMEAPSPCIQVCKLNAARVCVGCHRTIGEIAAWARLGNAEKREILRQLPARREPPG